jgi:cytochrome c oxidase subunit 2
MIKSEDLKLGQARVLETDNNLILPVNKWIRLLVTGVNVIHSFGVHSLGLKFDGIPGRLNSVSLQFARAGFFRGACMELCGILHAYMPIKIHAVPVVEGK